VSSNDVGESRIVENVSVLFKIAIVVENTTIDSCVLPSSLDEVHVSLEDSTDTSDVVDALTESSTPITDEINVHEDNHNSQETGVESIVGIPSVSSPSESLKFLVMLHKVNSGVSFSGCLDFFHEFLHICVVPNNVIPLPVSEVCPPRKPCLSFPYL